jgi:hypothetical protein
VWYIPQHTPEHRAWMSDTIGDDSNSPVSAIRRCHSSPKNTQVVAMLSQLTSTLPKLTASLAQIQDEVQFLSGRMDKLSASLRDGPGTEGSRRLALDSHGTRSGGLCQSTLTAGALREAGNPGIRATATGTSPSSPQTPQWEALRSMSNQEQTKSPRNATLKDIGSVAGNGGTRLDDNTAPLPNAISHDPDG